MKRLISILAAAAVLFGAVTAFAAVKTVRIKPGSFVRLGSYMGEPILWRCVGGDENGLLLISRSILCFKAYSDGSSRWAVSSLRTWLNSEDAVVDWGGQAPDEEHIDGNAYADEPGFLNGFAPEERALILTVENKSVLNENDSAYADMGGAVHLYNSTGQFNKSVQNYAAAYASLTEDRVFCPNISQMELVMANFPTEFIAAPTRAALDQTGSVKNSESSGNGYYWLRDSLGNGDFAESVRCVYPDGRLLFADAFESYIGVRPALYIKDEIPISGGNGYENSPYTVTDEILSSPLPVGSAGKNSGRVTASGASSSITEGEYLYMGRYNGGDILWRCVDVNENGPLMLSDRILCFKSFDAAGKHGDQLRDRYGSNNWAMSNIRTWLNSEEKGGVKDWPCGVAPTSDNCEGVNGYSKEPGFLSSFTPEEREVVAETRIRTVIFPGDADENTLGSEPLVSQRNVNRLGNYALAYSNETSDRIFLLGIGEVNRLKADFGSFLTASPTVSAVNLNEAYIEGLSADRSAVWWLRDADADVSSNVRAVTLDGWIHSIAAVRATNGVRPAFYLDMDKAAFLSGDGSADDPYRVEGHTFAEWEVTRPPTCTQPGVRSRLCLTCGESQEEAVPVTGHNFGKGAVTKKGIFSAVTTYVCANCGQKYSVKRAGLWPVFAGAAALALMALWAALRKIRRKD